MSEIPVSKEEALDLLQKWLQEKRVIHASVTAAGILVKIPGRLDDVNPEKARLSLTKSTFSAGPYTSLDFSLLECRFEYSDAEHAPEPLRSQLKGYDGLLYVYHSDVALGLAILPLSEWLNI
jgi:hypothetical protein